MKQGWEIRKLGEVCDIVNGSTPLRTNKDFWEGGDFPWFTIDDIREQGRTIRYTKQKITQSALKKLRILPINTILLCCTASIGEYAITEIELTTNQQFNGLVIKNKKELHPKFLLYFSSTLKETLSNLSGKTTIDFIPISRLKDIEIPLPSLPEQQRIVAILDEAFAAIAKAKANAEKNLKNSKELFESVLNGELSMVEGKLREGWEEKTLAQISETFGRGKSKHRPRNFKGLYGGDYPFIQTGDIRNCDHYVTEYTQTYNEMGLAQSKLWKKGTICITIAANIAETGVLAFDACFPDSVIGLVVNEKIADRDFVEYLLQFFKTRLQALGKGSAQANLNMGTFENELFPIPPLKQQQTIVKKLDALSLETKKLEAIYQQKLNDLEELKKSVLQKAFAGELKEKLVTV
jgi:type I restriction enzyme S subunit